MAVGDLKGPECVVILGTSGAAITVGQVVHIETDGFWDPVVDNDLGKFGVALDAAAGAAETVRVCIWGRVDVAATAATIDKGYLVMAGTTGDVAEADWAAGVDTSSVCGTAMEAIASGGTGTVWIGLVG